MSTRATSFSTLIYHCVYCLYVPNFAGACRVLPRLSNPGLGFQAGRRQIRPAHVHASLSGTLGSGKDRLLIVGLTDVFHTRNACISRVVDPGSQIPSRVTGMPLSSTAIALRLYGQGTISKGDMLFNLNSGKKLKVPRLVRMHSAEMQVRCSRCSFVCGMVIWSRLQR